MTERVARMVKPRIRSTRETSRAQKKGSSVRSVGTSRVCCSNTRGKFSIRVGACSLSSGFADGGRLIFRDRLGVKAGAPPSISSVMTIVLTTKAITISVDVSPGL
jgi:hypothetical protein